MVVLLGLACFVGSAVAMGCLLRVLGLADTWKEGLDEAFKQCTSTVLFLLVVAGLVTGVAFTVTGIWGMFH